MSPAPSMARPGTQVSQPPRTTAPAEIHCPRCGSVTAAAQRFCRECGTPLGAPAQAAPVAPAPPAAVLAASAPSAAAAQTAFRSLRPVVTSPDPTPQPFAPPGSLAPAVPGLQSARLVMLLRDGSEGRTIALGTADSDIGGREGDIVFDDDPYLSPRHARISCRGGTYTLRDLDSVNGVYVRLREAVDLRDRDMVLLGQQVLRFEALVDGELPLGPAWQGGVLIFGTPEISRFARLVQYTTEGVGRDVHYLFRDETVIGRENGDIVFTDDPFLSRRHAAIRIDHAGRRFTLHDLGSSNGTAIRIRGEHVLRNGDQFRIGRHLFRFEAGSAGGRAER
jgi:pSer/pThr/pTyr-binding forkhead associated (FHA) protein